MKQDSTIRLGLPKGSMQSEVFALLDEAGLRVTTGSRDYRPRLPLAGFDTKLLKPQNLVEMLALGSRDLGFAGIDWVVELELDLVEVLDTGFDPVRIVAATPAELLENGRLPPRRLVVASEYERITRGWIAERGLDAKLLRSYGATEVFPPEDADCIVDNTASGATLRSNGLVIVEEIMQSSTRLFASREAWEDPARRARIDDFVVLIQSVLDARERVMLELNVTEDALPGVVDALPCMREPTVAALHDAAGYALRAAVPRRELPTLIPRLRALGGTDLVVTRLEQIIP